MRQQRRCGRVLVGGAVVGALCLLGTPAQAAPAAGGSRPEGPWPPAAVLAKDPATVRAPSTLSAEATASCPAAAYGVRHYAPGTGKTVALTFDDGPGKTTEQIIGILEDAGVAATFFNIGINETVRPATVQAEAAQRFVLGNHTWSHPDLTTLSASAQATEMDRTTAEQTSLVGTPPCLFRPPYGSYNSTTLSLAQARNMAVWNWSVDTEDWKANGSASDYWVNRIITLGETGGSQTHPVVLMHNMPGGTPATAAALPTLIAYYRDRGYTFVDLTGRVASRPVTGDWDGNGSTTPGMFRGGTWYLRDSNSAGAASATFAYGRAGDRPVTGDWDGNGTTTVGVVRGSTWYLRNSNTSGAADVVLSYGRSTDTPLTGDWDGNGTTTPGVVRGGIWYLRNANSGGAASVTFGYGRATDRPVTGDWDGNGTTTIGVVRGATWYLRNANSSGAAGSTFTFGP